MALRAVIFDLGGVVLGSPVTAFREYETAIGLPAGSLVRVIGYSGQEGAWQRLERGEITMAQFFEVFDAEAAAGGLRISTAELMARVAVVTVPRRTMVTAIRRLRANGMRTAALTNNWVSDDQSHAMDVLRPEFDVFIESVRVGIRKPDPRIYALACQQLGLAADEIVFLDDIGHNLKPAKAMGMTTIKVVEPLAAIEELEKTLTLVLRD